MRICSYNVNGLRALHSKGALKDLYNKINPDLLCLQEVKCLQGDLQSIASQVAPDSETFCNSNSYNSGYAGVGVISKLEQVSMFPVSLPATSGSELQYFSGRIILIKLPGDIALVNVYTLNSGSKDDLRVRWDSEFLNYIQYLKSTFKVIIAGDLNVVRNETDHWKGLSNVVDQGPGLMKYEHDGIEKLLWLGFVDSYDYIHPRSCKYSWFSYRGQAYKKGHGWRLDYILVDDRLRDKINAANIYEDFLGSDHRPITLDITI